MTFLRQPPQQGEPTASPIPNPPTTLSPSLPPSYQPSLLPVRHFTLCCSILPGAGLVARWCLLSPRQARSKPNFESASNEFPHLPPATLSAPCLHAPVLQKYIKTMLHPIALFLLNRPFLTSSSPPYWTRNTKEGGKSACKQEKKRTDFFCLYFCKDAFCKFPKRQLRLERGACASSLSDAVADG